jgi:hypothetical protein
MSAFGSQANILRRKNNVRFIPGSGHCCHSIASAVPASGLTTLIGLPAAKAKLRLVRLVSHLANVRRRNNLFKLQQRQIHIPHWLFLDSSKAWPTSTKRSDKRT